ncbi:FLAVIN REDUCTASE-RELATED [Ceraceosorus bombacis]|uniref:FLAVIN REDUCTASE-RELATED n=1 Tax=Ceraceosorus bombacis TaxID=401625 RepID=A0A0P1BBQ1_9BASI|nr:FLAVIN REDUCTASE-RELATED [Ceraceosorus bombacis]
MSLPSSVHLHQADALSISSLSCAFQSIRKHGKVDLIVSSLGALPVFEWKGGLKPRLQAGLERICADGTKNLLDVMRDSTAHTPALIVVSSNGIGHESLERLPWILRVFYHHLLTYPHADKHEMEELLHRAYGLHSNDFNPSAKSSSERSAALFDPSKLLIVRPSLLTSGARTGKYRISEAGSTLDSAWTISREDVGHFIAESINESAGEAEPNALKRSGAYVVSY